MPRGDKSSYTNKQKRQAEHIEEGYEHRGVPDEEPTRLSHRRHNSMEPPKWNSPRAFLLLPVTGLRLPARAFSTRCNNWRGHMKTLVLAAALSLVATSAFATCKSDAADKKLAGAALKSFMTKCESDAKITCDADSASKKLAGAAKTSHMKKCVGDAVGT